MSARIEEVEEKPLLAEVDQPDSPHAQPKGEEVKHLVASLAALIAENINEQERVTTGIVKENTVWDVYNNEARKVDIELVKDWRESLNFLLVFAAIFAAVLTAFIIESKKMLEPDQAELLVNITVWNINNNGNKSNLPHSPPLFEPTSVGILINCLLFASLGASLVAALASVVALQWVADYDAAITRGGSSPEDRAKRRQFRFAGVVDWKMSEFIAALPLLLYSSVILFWAGAIQWMWTLHHIVGYVVAGGTLVAVLFYASTTLLGAVFVSSPFRTPLSRGMYWTLQPSITSILSFKWRSTAFRIASSPSYLPTRSLSATIFTWIKTHVLPNKTSRAREDAAAKTDTDLEQQALIWLAHQLPITADSSHRLGLLITEVLRIPLEAPGPEESIQNPWVPILESFSGQYMHRILKPTLPEDNYEDIGAFLHFIERHNIRNRLAFSTKYITDTSNQEYWSQCCFSMTDIVSSRLTSLERMSLLLTRDVPLPSIDSDVELRTTIRLIKWRNLTGPKSPSVWIDIFTQPGLYSAEYLVSCLQSFKLLISRGGRDVLSSLWPPEKEARDRSQQVARIFEVANYLLQKDDSVAFHHDLVALLCMNMSQQYHQCPLSPQSPDDIRNRIANIGDPCLERLVLVVWGVPITRNVMIPRAYTEKYKGSISEVRDILYHNTLSEDSEALWHARAATFRRYIDSKGSLKWCPEKPTYFSNPRHLTYLQRVLKYPTDCEGHSQGAHHILYHLYWVEPFVNVMQSWVILGDIEMEGENVDLLIGILVRSNTTYHRPLFSRSRLDTDCVERITDICKAVKQQPASLFRLLRDISVWKAQFSIPTDDVPLILEAVEQNRALLQDEHSALLLRPLALAIDRLGQKMLQNRYGGDLERARKVARHAKRIATLLHAWCAPEMITSHSHLRMFSCSQANKPYS